MSLWLFGYGSLIWKADFPYKRKISGFITGYDRRFYQASTDHRGVPGKPGRVVTLLKSEDPDSRVYGIAYEVEEKERPVVESSLDYREKCGYSKITVNFYPNKTECFPDLKSPMPVVTYVGLPNNEWYLGPAPLSEMATQIAGSRGPSGTNAEYFFKLITAVRALSPHHEDKHLKDLECALLEVIHTNGTR